MYVYIYYVLFKKISNYSISSFSAVNLDLIKEYLAVETLFSLEKRSEGQEGDDVISKLREENINKGMNRLF